MLSSSAYLDVIRTFRRDSYWIYVADSCLPLDLNFVIDDCWSQTSWPWSLTCNSWPVSQLGGLTCKYSSCFPFPGRARTVSWLPGADHWRPVKKHAHPSFCLCIPAADWTCSASWLTAPRAKSASCCWSSSAIYSLSRSAKGRLAARRKVTCTPFWAGPANTALYQLYFTPSLHYF